MHKYVALLRGIGPSNPNMRNDKLCKLFTRLGFKNVQAIISSGNVIFESRMKNTRQLESMIEKALPKYLGFKSTTIVRSHDDLLKLVKKKPFKGFEDAPNSRLNVTFLKNAPKTKFKLPHIAKDGTWRLLRRYDDAIPSVSDLTGITGPDFMVLLEREFGKEITTRTWKTVHRILAKLEIS